MIPNAWYEAEFLRTISRKNSGMASPRSRSRRSDGDGVIERAVAAAEAGGRLDGAPYIEARPRHGVEKAHLLGEARGDRRGERAARAVRAAARDAPVLEALEPAVVKQEVDDELALEMAALHQYRLGTKSREPFGSALHVGLDPHRKARQHLGLGQVRRQQGGHRQQGVAQG